jgi:hypothetical protein
MQHRRPHMIFVCKNLWKWRTEARIISWNTLFYVQEDISPWNSREWTTKVSLIFSQCSYLQTVLNGAFVVLVAFRIVAKPAFVLLVFSCLFQVPLKSFASLWRAGETRNDSLSKYCSSYVTELSVVLPVRAVIVPGLDIWYDLRFSQHRAFTSNDFSPHNFNVYSH